MAKVPVKPVKPVAATPAGAAGEQALTPSVTAPTVVDGASPTADAPPQPEPATTTYIVGDCPMLHDGDFYAPGEEIELTPKQARRSDRRVSLAVANFPKLNLE